MKSAVWGVFRRASIKAVLWALTTSTALLWLAACGAAPETSGAAQADSRAPTEATFYLVRHAEKELEGRDPELSAAGYERAKALAARLGPVELSAVYSTDTRRTRDTAAVVLAQKNMTLQIYDGRGLEDFAETLFDARGNILIVGHSNTTPQLAEALGGEGGSPIVEATEYDRLYILRRRNDAVETELQRY